MEEIVPDFILVTTYFILGSAGNIAIIWLYSKMIQPRTKAYKEIIVCFVEMRGDCMLC